MSDMRRVANLVSKPLTSFTPDDTIYVGKIKGGYSYTHLCQFVKYERGIVHAKVLSTEPSHGKPRSDEITALPSKCFLWGKSAGEPHETCHRFNAKTGCFGKDVQLSADQIPKKRILQVLQNMYLEGAESYWAESAKWAMILAMRLGLEDELQEAIGQLDDVYEWEVELTSSRTVNVLARNKEDAAKLVNAVSRVASTDEYEGSCVRDANATCGFTKVKRKVGKFKPRLSDE